MMGNDLPRVNEEEQARRARSPSFLGGKTNRAGARPPFKRTSQGHEAIIPSDK